MSIKKIITVIVILFIIFILWFINAIYSKTEIDGGGVAHFTVQKGEGISVIANNLEEANLIKSPLAFKLYLKLKGAANKVKAGEYDISDGLSIRALTKILAQGTSTEEINLTFIEGWGNNEMADYLVRQGVILKNSDFINLVGKGAASDFSGQFSFLKSAPPNASLEGYLFPDTYRFYSDVVPEEIVVKMLSNFDIKLNQKMRNDIDKQDKTIYDVLIMASILEREALIEADKKMIADIFYKRIKIGMPLQSDATVNYITKKKTTRPSIADTKVDSPYNTYKYKGLPPTPIANPGLTSIKAAVYPESNPYYYFLTTTDGTMKYAITHEQHVENKRKYLK